MSYLDKSNKLTPSRNLIVFVFSESKYDVYTLKDMEAVMASEKKILNKDGNLESFFYLSNGIVVDSTLSTCFKNKVNTMKLDANIHQFHVINDRFFIYYKVEPLKRKDIGSEEESTFELKMNKKYDYYTETIDHGNGITCEIEYFYKMKSKETWLLNGVKHRDGDLPAVICYDLDLGGDSKESEEYYINGELHRNNGPALIRYIEDCTYTESWYANGKLYRDNDLPVTIFYNYGPIVEELWLNKEGDYHRDNDLPAVIEYYNETKKSEEWWINGKNYRNNNKPVKIDY